MFGLYAIVGTASSQLGLPLLSVSAVADVTGLGVSVTLRQTYVHPYRYVPTSVAAAAMAAAAAATTLDGNYHHGTGVIECRYTFPLHEQATVTSFVAHLGARRVDGVLHERSVARSLYEQAKRVSMGSALLERAPAAQANVFTCSVGRLRPGEECVVEITYVAPLDMISESVTRFTVPLQLAPKFTPSVWSALAQHWQSAYPYAYLELHPLVCGLASLGQSAAAATTSYAAYPSLFAYPQLGYRNLCNSNIAYTSRLGWLARPYVCHTPLRSPSMLHHRFALEHFALRACISTPTRLHSVKSVHHAMYSTPVDAHAMNIELFAPLHDPSVTSIVVEVHHDPAHAFAVLELSDQFGGIGGGGGGIGSSVNDRNNNNNTSLTCACQIAIPQSELGLVDQTELPCELIFVLDCSGSMSGAPIESLRAAMFILLRSLPTNCVFNIVCFGSHFQRLFHSSVPYSEMTLQVACVGIEQMQANMGGTELLAPLLDVLRERPSLSPQFVPGGQSLPHQPLPRQVFLMTDGGVSNVDDIAAVLRHHIGSTRVFTFGIGNSVDAHMCRALARAGRGDVEFVTNSDMSAMSSTIVRQLARALQPALMNVRIDWGDLVPAAAAAESSWSYGAQLQSPILQSSQSGAGNVFRAPSASNAAQKLGFVRPNVAASLVPQLVVPGTFQQCPEQVPALFASESGCSFVYALNVAPPDAIVRQHREFLEQRTRKEQQQQQQSQASASTDLDEAFAPQLPDGFLSSFAIEYMFYVPGRGYEHRRVPLYLSTHVVLSDVIHRLAARERIEELEETRGLPLHVVDDAVLRLALQYGVTSRMTSFVAVEDGVALSTTTVPVAPTAAPAGLFGNGGGFSFGPGASVGLFGGSGFSFGSGASTTTTILGSGAFGGGQPINGGSFGGSFGGSGGSFGSSGASFGSSGAGFGGGGFGSTRAATFGGGNSGAFGGGNSGAATFGGGNSGAFGGFGTTAAAIATPTESPETRAFHALVRIQRVNGMWELDSLLLHVCGLLLCPVARVEAMSTAIRAWMASRSVHADAAGTLLALLLLQSVWSSRASETRLFVAKAQRALQVGFQWSEEQVGKQVGEMREVLVGMEQLQG